MQKIRIFIKKWFFIFKAILVLQPPAPTGHSLVQQNTTPQRPAVKSAMDEINIFFSFESIVLFQLIGH